eukprot:CAMPEP_0119221064 /NCGR_PEP_ID=MMETSP1327-20130426/27395_1 /TAXON_ID=38833 /ORGANISM="Micromonas pusilla, Strain RCC2306" /LENGTH=89 /DNA_ID=CAMNT_0007219217 /DNA_START=845 /DNA_END=1110 /DNA_ORIENTATION=-
MFFAPVVTRTSTKLVSLQYGHVQLSKPASQYAAPARNTNRWDSVWSYGARRTGGAERDDPPEPRTLALPKVRAGSETSIRGDARRPRAR